MSWEKVLKDQFEFSIKTFGPPRGVEGVIDHIRKEVEEVAEGDNKLEEFVDIAILAFDGAMRLGYTPLEVIAAYKDKMRINTEREWPDWRQAEPGKAIQHVKT